MNLKLFQRRFPPCSFSITLHFKEQLDLLKGKTTKKSFIHPLLTVFFHFSRFIPLILSLTQQRIHSHQGVTSHLLCHENYLYFITTLICKSEFKWVHFLTGRWRCQHLNSTLSLSRNSKSRCNTCSKGSTGLWHWVSLSAGVLGHLPTPSITKANQTPDNRTCFVLTTWAEFLQWPASQPAFSNYFLRWPKSEAVCFHIKALQSFPLCRTRLCLTVAMETWRCEKLVDQDGISCLFWCGFKTFQIIQEGIKGSIRSQQCEIFNILTSSIHKSNNV